MLGRRSLLIALCAPLTTLPAHAADAECQVVRYVWELELVQVAAEVDIPGLDLNAVAAELGTKARIGGGIVDPGRPREPVRVELLGSSDGAGLRLGLERAP